MIIEIKMDKPIYQYKPKFEIGEYVRYNFNPKRILKVEGYTEDFKYIFSAENENEKPEARFSVGFTKWEPKTGDLVISETGMKSKFIKIIDNRFLLEDGLFERCTPF